MPDVAYANLKGKAGYKPRRIYKGERRKKVADLTAQGLSQRDIAKELGVGKTTVARDQEWLKTSEHLLRAQETAVTIVEEEMPTSVSEFREQERQNVINLLAKRMTYEQVANKLGVSISTVVRHVNAYLDEYGDFGGRTLMEWRNEHLLKSYDLMAELEKDMNCQPVEGENGWDLTPFQAQRTRDAARKRMLELMQYQARLLQLLVQKTEVEVEQKVVVMKLGGVNMSAFPPQDDVIQGEVVDATQEIAWST